MWKGRFRRETAESMREFGQSVTFDRRLYRHDIDGSVAHAAGLLACGLLTEDEFDAIKDGLMAIGRDIEAGRFEWDTALEDVHMNIEAELTRRIGAPGAKLHTARSRNDQIATATRLYLREAGRSVAGRIEGMQRELLAWARREDDAVLPGYTHLQRAQPVYFAHHLLAYVEMLGRDAERLGQAVARMDVSPLGSGALAGTTLPVDRSIAAGRLEFGSLTRNSMDAVADRDFVAEFLWVLAMLGVHLSRFCEDVVLWASAEFGFVTLGDDFTTGSSLMPQKKNPDAAELMRGKTGRLIGNLVTVLTLLKGLPMTYNRDLQEDKEPLFDSIDTVLIGLDVLAGMVAGASLNRARAGEAASDPLLLATDLADYLVARGVPFREAHAVVGRLTARALDSGKTYPELGIDAFREESDRFDEDVFECLDARRSLDARRAVGAPALGNVRDALTAWEERLDNPHPAP